jgi:DNA repair protein RecN (Recombination protein N)
VQTSVSIFALVLKQLWIQNFAIIDELSIQFEQGFTVITGETGAGKSILLGALSLILGERADLSLIPDTKKKCIIEGHFDIQTNHRAHNLLVELGYDAEHEIILRRELSSAGKSRIFLNDTPSNLQHIQQLAALLIDLHRQFDTLEMRDRSQQLWLLDQMLPEPGLRSSYEAHYQAYKLALQNYEQVRAENIRLKKEMDYDQFLFDELNQFQPKPDELEDAETELIRLNSSESSKTTYARIVQLLDENDHPVSAMIKQCRQLLDQVPESEMIQDLKSRLSSVQIEVKDISHEINHLHDQTHYDQEAIQILTDRINEGNRLLKKHHVQRTNDLIGIATELENKIAKIRTADEREIELAKSSETLRITMEKSAAQLSASRLSILTVTEKQVNERLKLVGMPNARFQIHHQMQDYTSEGMDLIEFQLDANKSDQYKPIFKVASGGELSRLMLCIKSLLASGNDLPTLLFDEIDTGISGETAIQVGDLLQSLSKNHQVISITHLPQIAAKARQHLFIYKTENELDQIRTRVKQLEKVERIQVLAEMMGGTKSDEQTRKIAENWLSGN